MIRRLYVHNFRCFENFELRLAGLSSALLIGDNGSGKSTVGLALRILQSIAQGTNRVLELIAPKDLTRGRNDIPVRLEIEVELESVVYEYQVALELPQQFKELRVREERLIADGRPVFTREFAQVHLTRSDDEREADFRIDWHLLALPIIQTKTGNDPLGKFRQWLSRLLILRPVPSLILGESTGETLQPNMDVTNFGAWFAGVLAHAPSAYSKIDRYLSLLMPDFKDVMNPEVARDARSLAVRFSTEQGIVHLPFEDLSDGEKCFLISALVLAATEVFGPICCYWDEPDNFLALSEVGHFVMALRSAVRDRGQFIATSHNPEAIRRFSNENTFVLRRSSHLEPTTLRRLDEMEHTGDLIETLIRGDLRT